MSPVTGSHNHSESKDCSSDANTPGLNVTFLFFKNVIHAVKLFLHFFSIKQLFLISVVVCLFQ